MQLMNTKQMKSINSNNLRMTISKNMFLESHSRVYNQRRLLSSQCTKRTKKKSPNGKTPLPRTSLSSHDRSTEISTYDNLIKYRTLPKPSKKIFLFTKRNKSFIKLGKEILNFQYDISKIVFIQK